jgi:AraC-like DNA-binding protein
MEPVLLKVNQPDTMSFSVNQFHYLSSFPGLWHYHPEYELTLIVRGQGIRFVGDHLERFEEGDLVLIGKNLAHTWKSDPVNVHGPSEAIVAQFREDFLGELFLKLPEMIPVRSLLQQAARGIKVTGASRAVLADQMKQMYALQGAARLLHLLSLLTSLAETEDAVFLASEGYCNHKVESDSERLNTVYGYIMTNFQKPIRLTDVAEMAHMSPTAFSRYFTQRTRKSFSQFLIEKKVGYACRLLIGRDLSILQICYECGFQNVSSFNKQFKKITSLTPKQYQQNFRPFGHQQVKKHAVDSRLVGTLEA